MDHSQHIPLIAEEITEANLIDAVVYSEQDERIGTISHVHGFGADTAVVIDVGGFLGFGSKPVSIPANQLNFMRDSDGTVHAMTAWTKDDLKALPEHSHSGMI